MHLEWRDVRLTEHATPIETAVTEHETGTLQALAAGARVLEVGAGRGYSAIVMALAGAVEVVSVDSHTIYGGNHLEAYRHEYGVADRIEMIEGDSREVMPELFLRGKEYDLVFIDGDHAQAVAESDVRWAYHLVSDRGAIAVHDYAEDCCCAEVKPAVDKFAQVSVVVDTMAVFSKANYLEKPPITKRLGRVIR